MWSTGGQSPPWSKTNRTLDQDFLLVDWLGFGFCVRDSLLGAVLPASKLTFRVSSW